MRHRMALGKLNRTSEHRKAMLRNLAQNLIEHGQITTTLAKARNIRPVFERLVTLALRLRQRQAAGDRHGALRARRAIHRVLSDRAIIPVEHIADYESMSDAGRAKTLRMTTGRRYRTGEPKGRLKFTAESVTHRLVEKIAPQFEGREGGYTRLIRLATVRLGDNSPLAVVQLVGNEEPPMSLTKPAKSARQRRTDARYALAVKAAKSWSGKRSAAPAAETAPATDAEPS